MIRMIVIYQYKDSLYTQAYSKTTDGVSTLDGPVFIVSDFNETIIGTHVLKAFEQCKVGIFHHIEWRDGPIKSEMLEATKCKTWNALMKASKSIDIYENKEGSVTVMPSRFGGVSGPDKGYHDLEDKAIISSTDPVELGRNVIKALELCE